MWRSTSSAWGKTSWQLNLFRRIKETGYSLGLTFYVWCRVDNSLLMIENVFIINALINVCMYVCKMPAVKSLFGNPTLDIGVPVHRPDQTEPCPVRRWRLYSNCKYVLVIIGLVHNWLTSAHITDEFGEPCHNSSYIATVHWFGLSTSVTSCFTRTMQHDYFGCSNDNSFVSRNDLMCSSRDVISKPGTIKAHSREKAVHMWKSYVVDSTR